MNAPLTREAQGPSGVQRLGGRGHGTENMLCLSFPTQVSVSLQPGSSRASKTAPVHKPAAPSEEKKPETAVSRLQRREQLKKSNTLPTSVTGRAWALPQHSSHVCDRWRVGPSPLACTYSFPPCSDCHSTSDVTQHRFSPDQGSNSDTDSSARTSPALVERQ